MFAEVLSKRPIIAWRGGLLGSQSARRRICVCCLAALAAACCGCESEPPAAPAAAKPESAPKAVFKLETIDESSLPAVGKTAPLLDEGRLQFSLPEGWVWAPRSKDYLIRALPARDARYPSITLYVDADAEVGDATKENVIEFSEEVQKNLVAELAPQGIRLAAPVRAVRIGSFFGAEYVRKAKAGAESVERLFLVTASKGRKYSLELRVLEGSLPRYRDLALAVAASMRFEPADSSKTEAATP